MFALQPITVRLAMILTVVMAIVFVMSMCVMGLKIATMEQMKTIVVNFCPFP